MPRCRHFFRTYMNAVGIHVAHFFFHRIRRPSSSNEITGALLSRALCQFRSTQEIHKYVCKGYGCSPFSLGFFPDTRAPAQENFSPVLCFEERKIFPSIGSKRIFLGKFLLILLYSSRKAHTCFKVSRNMMENLKDSVNFHILQLMQKWRVPFPATETHQFPK